MMNSDTPRTDAEECEIYPSANPDYDGPYLWVEACFARTLERELAAANKRIKSMEDCFDRLWNWAEAYPIEVFPEPEWEKSEAVLKAAGMGLSSISASNMRHVITGVKEIIKDFLP